jgi:hypothetical protein
MRVDLSLQERRNLQDINPRPILNYYRKFGGNANNLNLVIVQQKWIDSGKFFNAWRENAWLYYKFKTGLHLPLCECG